MNSKLFILTSRLYGAYPTWLIASRIAFDVYGCEKCHASRTEAPSLTLKYCHRFLPLPLCDRQSLNESNRIRFSIMKPEIVSHTCSRFRACRNCLRDIFIVFLDSGR